MDRKSAGVSANTIEIITVSYNTADLIIFQEKIMRQLASRHTKLKWHVVDTSPSPHDQALLRAVPGIILYESDLSEQYRPDRCPGEVSPRSYQHAMALNFLLDRVSGDNALIIDPDCFIVSCNWDLKLLDAKSRQRAAIIGAPYHPARRFKHGLGFPTPTLMFTSLPELTALGGDFSPGKYPNFSSPFFRNSILRFLKYGTWRDTGWRIIERARQNRWTLISLDAPLLRPQLEPKGLWRKARRIVPQRFLFFPKFPFQRPDEGLISEDELSAAPGGALYEEYYFNNELFCCHLRGVSQRGLDFSSAEVQFWLERITAYARRQAQSKTQEQLSDRRLA